MHAAISVGVLFAVVFFGTYILQAIICLVMIGRWLVITTWSLAVWLVCFCINPRRALESVRAAPKEGSTWKA
jgi:hypothetical protein